MATYTKLNGLCSMEPTHRMVSFVYSNEIKQQKQSDNCNIVLFSATDTEKGYEHNQVCCLTFAVKVTYRVTVA